MLFVVCLYTVQHLYIYEVSGRVYMSRVRMYSACTRELLHHFNTCKVSQPICMHTFYCVGVCGVFLGLSFDMLRIRFLSVMHVHEI
jgi:hypothetical protein